MFLLQPAQPPVSSQARPKLAVGNGDGLSYLLFCAARGGPHPAECIRGSGGGVTNYARSAPAIIVLGKALAHSYGSYGHYAEETPFPAIHLISDSHDLIVDGESGPSARRRAAFRSDLCSLSKQ